MSEPEHVYDDEGIHAPDCPVCAAMLKRRIDFLEALGKLCHEHGLYLDAWATYADDAFFGVEEMGEDCSVWYELTDYGHDGNVKVVPYRRSDVHGPKAAE